MTEDGADLPDYTCTKADGLLDTIYGDHPHDNDGTHLSGGVESDRIWQRRWLRACQLKTTHYDVPSKRVGRRFVDTFAIELQGVKDGKWNSERALVFPKLILQNTPEIKSAGDIRRRIEQRMDLWDQGKFASLLDDIEAEVGKRMPSRKPRDKETRARAYNARVLSGRVRSAVRQLTDRSGGGILQPDDICEKAGTSVLKVLEAKHPAMRDPNLEDPNSGVFEDYADVPSPVPIITACETVEKVASKISGGARPSGVDPTELSNWLHRQHPNTRVSRTRHCKRSCR